MSFRCFLDFLKSPSITHLYSFFNEVLNGCFGRSTRKVHSKYFSTKICSNLSISQRNPQAIKGKRVYVIKTMIISVSIMVNIKKSTCNKKPHLQNGVLRHRADSNRCRSFCRALPSHSATVPFEAQKYIFLKIFFSFFCYFYGNTFSITIYWRTQFANTNRYFVNPFFFRQNSVTDFFYNCL